MFSTDKEISYLDMEPGQLVHFKSATIKHTLCFKTALEIENYIYVHKLDIYDYNNNYETYSVKYPYDVYDITTSSILLITEKTVISEQYILYDVLINEKQYCLPFNHQLNTRNRTWHLLGK